MTAYMPVSSAYSPMGAPGLLSSPYTQVAEVLSAPLSSNVVFGVENGQKLAGQQM